MTTLETEVGGTLPDDDLGAGRRRTTMARWRTTGPSSAERVGFEPTDHFKGGPRISSAVRSTRLRHLSRRERRLSLSPSAAHRPSIRLGRCGIEPAPVGHNPVGATAGTSAGAGAVDDAVDDGVGGGIVGVVGGVGDGAGGGAGDGACVGAGTGTTVRGRPASAGPSSARRPAPCIDLVPLSVPVAVGRSGVRTGSPRGDSGKFRRSRVMNGPLHRLPSTGLRAGGRYEVRETTHR